ncbi:TlpA family protein disulfide reductase [bacterium]|nr:TlpA family protein disulfide reductase [bacterium]
MKLWKSLNLLILALCITLISTNVFAEDEDAAPFIGKKAPVFSAKTLKGKELDLKDFKGKLVLVDFWATWCPPCRGELPHLKEVYKKYHKKGLEIISISSENGEVIKPFVVKNEMVWHQVSDSQRKIGPDYKVKYIPSPFLIGPDGLLIAKGADLRMDNLEKTIEKHIDKVDQETLKETEAEVEA